MDSEVCVLLLFPDPRESAAELPAPIRGLKDAPYFQPVDIHVRPLDAKTIMQVEGSAISIARQSYEQRIQVVECRFTLPDPLSSKANQKCEAIQNLLVRALIPPEHLGNGMYEQYVILLLQDLAAGPDEFVQENGAALSRFIRSQREFFDQGQIDQILGTRIPYSRDELTIVDWEGAVVIAPADDSQSDIELLKIGNYQLLSYRLLDRTLDGSLQTISRQFRANPRRFRPGPTRSQIRRIIQHRLDIMLDFEHTEQNLLLIGDWYTAQLYHAIRDEFYLEEWKNSIKDKLDNLERVIQTIQENFSLTWTGLLERVELIGWIVLLIGYFILFFMEEIVAKP